MLRLVLVLLVVGTVVAQDASWDSRQACIEPKEPAEPVDEFICGSRASFPLKEYEEALRSDAKTGEVVASYEDMAETETAAASCPAKTYVSKPEDAAADNAIVSLTSWVDLCPTWHYTIWRWGIYLWPHGLCYVLTPIKVTRCQRPNHACRYICPYFRTRCRQVNRLVHILVFCPRPRQHFHWISRLVPSCCHCQRLICGHHARLGSAQPRK